MRISCSLLTLHILLFGSAQYNTHFRICPFVMSQGALFPQHKQQAKHVMLKHSIKSIRGLKIGLICYVLMFKGVY